MIRTYGATVIGIGRSEEKMLSLSKELGDNASRFSYRLFDVSQKQSWESFALDLQRENISPALLINNAGAFPTFCRASNLSSETVERILQINYVGTMYATNAISAVHKDVCIVNISSSAALCSVVGTAAYSASKAALKAYTEVLQMEEKERYIGIVYPGTTKTELFRNDENTQNSALDIIAMPAQKMANKIAKKILKKRKRSIVGWDAKLMTWTAKLAPVKGLALIAWVMKTSRSKVFDNVFDIKE